MYFILPALEYATLSQIALWHAHTCRWKQELKLRTALRTIHFTRMRKILAHFFPRDIIMSSSNHFIVRWRPLHHMSVPFSFRSRPRAAYTAPFSHVDTVRFALCSFGRYAPFLPPVIWCLIFAVFDTSMWRLWDVNWMSLIDPTRQSHRCRKIAFWKPSILLNPKYLHAL